MAISKKILTLILSLVFLHLSSQCFFWQKREPSPMEETSRTPLYKTAKKLLVARNIISKLTSASYIIILAIIASGLAKNRKREEVAELQTILLLALIPAIIIPLL